MKRFFTILEGAGKGEERVLASPRAIIGRSKNADIQIDDPAISRRHLEVRIEDDAVFVENASTHGSLLNGKALNGVVSLNAGDELQVGRTRLRYEESAAEPASAPRGAVSRGESDPDGTQVAPLEMLAGAADSGDDGEAIDGTRVVESDHTRMASEKELDVVFKRQPAQKAAVSTKPAVIFLVVVALLAVGGGALWFFGLRDQSPVQGTMELRDSLYGYRIEYPAGWSRNSDKADVVTIGLGKEGAGDWVRVIIRGEKHPEHALTGLKHGFLEYRDVLKKRFPDIEITENDVREINGATGMRYLFRTPSASGFGFYLLNADTRLVVECYSARATYGTYRDALVATIGSLTLTAQEGQQYLDFPLPEAVMRQLALGSPATLDQQVEQHRRLGDSLVAARDVRPDNLFRARQHYREALQLAVAGPERRSGYAAAARGLVQAMKLFNARVERQRFEINRAIKERDAAAANMAAHQLLLMVPDKTDPVYEEAYRIQRRTQLPEGQ